MTEREQPQESADPILDATLNGLEARIKVERNNRAIIQRAKRERIRSNLEARQRQYQRRREEKESEITARKEAWLKAAETDLGKGVKALGIAFAEKAREAKILTRPVLFVGGSELSNSLFWQDTEEKKIYELRQGWQVQRRRREGNVNMVVDNKLDSTSWTDRKPGVDGVSVLTDGRIIFLPQSRGHSWKNGVVLFDSPLHFSSSYLTVNYEAIFAKFLVDHGV